MSAVVVEIPDALMSRLRGRAEQEGVSVEQKALQLLQSWAQVEAPSPEEFHKQVQIAREELDRYRNTFRELSR